MIQGAGSDVGKSLLVAGLCRAALRRGLSVAPFKPQNMSNNAAVAEDGGEIGRAQALQARAAGRTPSVHMNPVLLKPESETGAQVVAQGRAVASTAAADYAALKPRLMGAVLDSFARIAATADLVLVEGAGSPAEINLRAGDIANMGFARAAGVPVVLVGDIERGGVIAQLAGTQAVLDPADAAMIVGFIVNKFRGDPRLFDGGRAEIARRTGWADLGLVAWFPLADRLPAEDALGLRDAPRPGGLRVGVPVLPRIANFDDLDPLRLDPAVSLTLARAGSPLPGDLDLVVLPGSKSTRADLAALRAEGWDVDIAAHVRRGGRVLGLCGGYQRLGRVIADASGADGPPGAAAGLGLLDVVTVMAPEKRVAAVSGVHAASGAAVSGYEIHAGRSEGPDCARPWLTIGGRPEGAVSPCGRIAGAYVHGVFAADAFREAFLASLGAPSSAFAYEAAVESALDALAAHLEASLDIDGLLARAAPAAAPLARWQARPGLV
jgi:adenosylcobyric acid synthase